MHELLIETAGQCILGCDTSAYGAWYAEERESSFRISAKGGVSTLIEEEAVDPNL